MAHHSGHRVIINGNRREQWWVQARRLWPAVFLLLAVLGCSINPVTSTPTPPPPPPPTPAGNTFYFNAPYSITLPPQTRVPGTRILYIGLRDGFYEFQIDGLIARYVVNNSLNWDGVIAPSVVADYRLTVLSSSGDQVFLNGTTRVSVLNPQPVEIPISLLPETVPDFSNIPIDYLVPPGQMVPGTTLRYEGQQDGNAIFSGGSGLPAYPLGNSVIYSGRLTTNVIIRYDLVVSRLDDSGVGLSGPARVWITNLNK
jgi:hypothetical protein